jgi:ubiquinone/menaquinone biosynthesis C-methylase UbiE
MDEGSQSSRTRAGARGPDAVPKPDIVPKPQTGRGQYDVNYGHFQSELYEEIRREAYGEDIGQNSWHTAEEQDRFLGWLDLSPGKRLLDVACGAGGPALRIAAITGCSVVGIDVHEQAIATACSLAVDRGMCGRAEFLVTDAAGRLPFPDGAFDAITCIDSINHLPERRDVLAEWARLLKPGGRLLFTDPTTITGPLTNAEIAIRSSAGFYLFVPPGYDERMLAAAGLRLLAQEDVTGNMATIAERRRAARASTQESQRRESRRAALREIEGDAAYEGQQQFLTIAARIAQEGRLSRFVLVAERL